MRLDNSIFGLSWANDWVILGWHVVAYALYLPDDALHEN